MRRLSYVVCDVFTDTPLTGNQLAVFTDARDARRRDDAGARARDELRRVGVRPAARGARTPTCASGSSRPARELPFAGHPTLGSAFVLAGPLSKIVIRLETGAGVVPVELEREGPKIVFGRMEQPLPPWSPAENVEAILAVGRRRALRPARRALRARPGPRLRRARLAGAGRRARTRLRGDGARDRTTASTALRATAPAGRRGCSRRPTA